MCTINGWYFWVYARVPLLRRESSTHGQVGWLHTRWVRGEEGKFKKLREVGSLLSYLTAGENYFSCVRLGRWSRYSQVLLLPLGIPQQGAGGQPGWGPRYPDVQTSYSSPRCADHFEHRYDM